MHSFTPYLNWIDSQKNILLERVKQWVAINSYSLNIKGLNQCLHLLTSSFQCLGGEKAKISLASQKILSSDGIFYEQPLGEALVIRKRPNAAIQVLLGGHFDTVYSPESPFQKMEEVSPGIWKGPGISDMKGGLAILLTTLETLERSPFASKIGWEILLTPDEEIGSPGSTTLYQLAAKRHHVGLIFEPAFTDGALVSERKGSTTYTVVIEGRAAHVGRDFSNGRSAVFALAHFINQLRSFSCDPDLTVNVTDLEGKGPVNVVPPLASCRINFRSSNFHALQSTSHFLHELAQQTEKDGIKVKFIQDTFRGPKLFDNKTKLLFDAYSHCASELNVFVEHRSTGGVCDGNILAEAGLPTLDTAGAVGGALHTPQEYLFTSSLVERSKLAALFLLKLASGEIIIDKEVSHG